MYFFLKLSQCPILNLIKPILYVSNIHSKVVEDDLRQIFSPFGDIRNCVLIKDYITGRHKTYGFVEFATVKVILINTKISKSIYKIFSGFNGRF